MGEHHREAAFVGQDINQTAADNNGVAYAESLNRSREHDPRPHRPWQFDIVCHYQIIDDRLKDFVHLAFSSQQPGILMTLSSACCCHWRCACRGEASCAAELSSLTVESTTSCVSSESLPPFCKLY